MCEANNSLFFKTSWSQWKLPHRQRISTERKCGCYFFELVSIFANIRRRTDCCPMLFYVSLSLSLMPTRNNSPLYSTWRIYTHIRVALDVYRQTHKNLPAEYFAFYLRRFANSPVCNDLQIGLCDSQHSRAGTVHPDSGEVSNTFNISAFKVKGLAPLSAHHMHLKILTGSSGTTIQK